MKILGIETSCDETAAAVVETRSGASSGIDQINVLSNIVSSQIDIHKKYGGVVPEVAAREHVLNILPVINEALGQAGIITTTTPNKSPLPSFRKGGLRGIDAIAVTVGPGLITSLIIGVETAKTLSCAWGIPIIAINHIEGHIYANFIDSNSKLFPTIILTVSGGHTMLVLMKGHGQYKIIGDTRDDAAGEVFDKAAQLLNLGYPGGPAIAVEATKYDTRNTIHDVRLPRPMINANNFEFSFSGLKTALLYQIKKDPLRLREGEASKNWQNKIPEYAAELQQAIIDVLISKTIKAAKKYQAKTVMLSGGVAANKELRTQLKKTVIVNGYNFSLPDLKYCTDNAVMVATAGCYRASAPFRKGGEGGFTPWQKLIADSNLNLK
jgi:N6-L-threonylcarbamoyladenine synthase